MPFAETVIGSRRCCRMVKWSAALSWFGSLCGILLSYYLSSVSAFNALNAGYILVFALLWLLPTLLLADLVRRY
jgi:ABC-type Mn2+/Zn2+ transport system permease subunit